jgi:hypothetical protein
MVSSLRARPSRLAPCAALALLAAVPVARAASGGPDAFGHEWLDDQSGCSTDTGAWGPGATVLENVALGDWIGPVPLGFVMPFYGEPFTEVWISPHGYLTFSPQAHVTAPAALPDAAGPNGLIAAHWVGPASLHVANVRHEELADTLHVEWEQWVGPTWARVSTHLLLHRDGSFRIAWQSFDDGFDVLVGHEDASGLLGLPLYQRDGAGVVVARDGSFPEPRVGRSACIRPPPPVGALDCATAEPVACGVTSSASPALVGTNVELYGCGTRRWSGHEKVFALELSELSDVDLSLQAGGRDLAVFLLSACNEHACLDGGGLVASGRTLPPGSYLVVVDAADPAQHGAFTLDVDCRPISAPIACEETALGTTLGGPSRLDAHGCLPGDFSGPESYYLLDFAGPGNVDVSLGSATAQAVFLYEAGRPVDPADCLAGGGGGAVLWQPPPGRYLVVVDGPAASAGDFTIAVACAPRIACSPAGPPIGCHDAVSGTTLGAPSGVEAYRCSGQRYSGPETVHELTVLDRQVVSVLLDDSADPRLDLLLLDDCDEGTCLAVGDSEVSLELEPGSYRLVVDGRDGASGPYALSTICGNGLEPAALSIVGAAGECFTESKSAWLTPAIVQADVLFAIDLSGSMTAEAEQLKANMADIVDRLGLVVSDLAFGLVSYRDYPWSGAFSTPCPYDGTFALPDDWPYRLEQPITTDPAAIRAAVDALPMAGGDIDQPAAYNRMMFEAYSDPAVAWRPGSRRLLVNFGDALPHDCNVLECLGGTADQQRAIDLGRDGLPETGDELATLPVVDGLAAARITLLHLDSSGGGRDGGFVYREIWDCWAQRTGGVARALEPDGTVPAGIDLAELIEQLVREQGSLCERLELVASPGYEDWLASASPVYLDQALPTRAGFDIEVCVPPGTPPGTHVFEVQLTCDGGVAAVQRLEVTVTTGCEPSVVVPPADVAVCEGDGAVLDGSGVSLVNCAGAVAHAWWQGGTLVGTGPVVVVSPAGTTDYELIVSCPTDPACEHHELVTVEVHAPPVFGPVQAADLAECNAGIQLSWSPATFRDPSGTGSYNVYRSLLDCSDALGRLPVATGLSGTSWVDPDTEHGLTYHYVVEAEDALSPSACGPGGAQHGGGATRSCAGPVTEVAVPWVPEGVGAALRATHQGQEITLEWSRARALLPDEHVHLLKSVDGPTGLFVRASAEGERGRSHVERDESARLQLFDLRVANPCEVESEDEFPPSRGLP